MDLLLYDWLKSIVGELPPTPNKGEIVMYICATLVCLFVVWSLLNMVLTLFKWIWGRL